MKLNINKINKTYGTSFEDVQDFLTLRTRTKDQIHCSRYLMPSDDINIIPISDATWTDQPEIEKLFDNDDQILIALKFHPTFEPHGITKESFKFGVTHAQAVIKEGGNVFTVNNPQDHLGGIFGDDIAYPTIFLKPKDITRDQYKNIRNWLLILNSITTFPEDYNGGDDINIKTFDDVSDYACWVGEAIGGNQEAKDELDKYPVYCAELIYLAFNLGMNVPIKWDESMDEVAEIMSENLNPFVNLMKFRRVNRHSSKNKLVLHPLSSVDMLTEFARKATYDEFDQFALLKTLINSDDIEEMIGNKMKFFPPHAFLKKCHLQGREDSISFEYMAHGFSDKYVI